MSSTTTTRTWGIGTHLVTLAIGPMLAALLTTAAIIGYLDVSAIRRTKAEQLQIQAEMVAFNASAAVVSRDETTAQRFLASLKAQSDVRMGCILDLDGHIVARFSSLGAIPIQDPRPKWTGYRDVGDGLIAVVVPVIHAGEAAGYVYVLAEMEDASRAILRYVLVLLLVLTGAVLLAWRLAARLKTKIAAPIAKLADVARVVSQQDDYGVRAPIDGPTEARELAQTFNQMLDEVSSSRAMLQQSAEQLEIKVCERTLQLSDEIRHRERVEVDLRESKAAADAANQAKSTFLANMSHEIRTPLNGILGFTKLLISNDEHAIDQPTRLDFLQTIDRSGEQLLALINDVLDLSKVEAGKLDIERIPCHPAQIVNDVLSLCRPRAQEKGLVVAHQIDTLVAEDVNAWLAEHGAPPLERGGVPARILSDPLRLRQIITNLVSNAVKFHASGEVGVVSKLVMLSCGPALEIAVRDTGIGIPADKCEAIFEPFVQADSSTTRKFGGTGLGLSISRRFAEAMGGSLTVTSEMGVGSTFHLRLPIELHDDEVFLTDPRQAGQVDSAAKRETGPRLSGRVLVVDDGETNRKLAQAVLERCGIEVALAENGAEGVQQAQESSFDVILMDVQMPVMDGHEATARLRELGFTQPIIAITAAAMPGDVERCLSVGCTDYLTKPFAPQALLDKVAQYLKQNAAHAMPAMDEVSADSESLVSQLPMDDPVFRTIVRQFITTLETRIKDLEAAVQEEAWTRVSIEAHWLKGAAGTVGFPAFTAPATEVSAAAKRGDFSMVQEQLRTIKRLAASIECPA